MMKIKLFCLLVLATVFIAPKDADAILLTFEDLTLDRVYNVGDSFSTNSVTVQVQQFYPMIDVQLGGTAKVDNFGKAGATGLEPTLNNVNLKFLLNYSGPSSVFAFMFADQGDDICLGINGVVERAANFTSLPGTIGGANVYVAGGYPFGIIMITGSFIVNLTIGGQNLSIDNVLVYQGDIPEPATIVLLGLGGLGLLVKKRRDGPC